MMNGPEYRNELMGRMRDIGKLSPDTLAGDQALSKAGSKTGHPDTKTRELIALAVSVTSREEIAEALGVAVAPNAGAALMYSARVMDAVSPYGASA